MCEDSRDLRGSWRFVLMVGHGGGCLGMVGVCVDVWDLQGSWGMHGGGIWGWWGFVSFIGVFAAVG